MSWNYIALGFRTDCYKLLSHFENSEFHTYRTFAEIWKKMKFSYIYYGRKSFSELLEFTEEVFKISKEFLSHHNSLSFQIGSIYLMYGLYIKQPTREVVKIRLTLQDFELLNEVCNIALSYQANDVLLIISRLYFLNAFHFCSVERQVGLEKKFRKYYESGTKSVGESIALPVAPLYKHADMLLFEDAMRAFYEYDLIRRILVDELSLKKNIDFKERVDINFIENLKRSINAMIKGEDDSQKHNLRLKEQSGHGKALCDVTEESADEGSDVPWWQCKKKMPWWRRCHSNRLPKLTKMPKHAKKNISRLENDEDAIQLLEDAEDVDDPVTPESSHLSRFSEDYVPQNIQFSETNVEETVVPKKKKKTINREEERKLISESLKNLEETLSKFGKISSNNSEEVSPMKKTIKGKSSSTGPSRRKVSCTKKEFSRRQVKKNNRSLQTPCDSKGKLVSSVRNNVPRRTVLPRKVKQKISTINTGSHS